MAFDDILFDAKKLVKAIQPAAWGQGFAGKQDDCGAYPRGEGISLARVIDCLKDAKRSPAPNEGYVTESSIQILIDLFALTARKAPLCKSAADIRSRLADVVEANTGHFSHGERVLLDTLVELVSDDQKLTFYLVFQETLDRLLRLATRE